MRRKLQKWTEDTAEELREISRDIAWTAEKIYKTAKDSFSIPELPAEQKKASRQTEEQSVLCRQTKQAYLKVADPEAEQQELTRELQRAVHGAYYREGGVRFYGICLERYVRVELEQETNLPKMWAAGYNTCIQPMLRQLEQLEKKMAAICSEYQQKPLPLNNEALLQTMCRFYTRALEDKLHLETGWEPEAYRKTLELYGKDLREQLLIPFRSLDES